MQVRTVVCCLLVQTASVFAQIASYPYSEGFDNVAAPLFPEGWTASGFSIVPTSPKSAPQCISATGNTSAKQISSPIFNFTNKIPETLVFYERRSLTAAGYRLEIRSSIDGDSFTMLLARFDTISSTANYVQRVISLEKAGLQQQSNVRFRWQVLGDNTNTTGVLRIDDVSLTVSAGSDVGLSTISSVPHTATRKDSIKISATVKNYGIQPCPNFSLHVFRDDNANGICEPAEQCSVFNGMSLDAGDSLTCVVCELPLEDRRV